MKTKKEAYMLRKNDKQSSFMDADYICERLVPQDSFYRKFKELVTPLIKDEHFEDMYCKDNGRPAISPALLACACILQFYMDLSDQEIEDACAFDIRVKHALGLAIDERPFASSSVGDFRRRLLENGREKEIFDRILKHLIESQLIGKNEIQRIDATHVIADVAVPTAIRLIRKSTYEILKMVKNRRKDIWDIIAKEIEIRDYHKSMINKEIPWKPEERSHKKVLIKVVTEAKAVLRHVMGLELGEKFDYRIDMLKLVLNENVKEEENSGPRVLENKEKPKDYMISPIDPDARFGVKSASVKFAGYKANITESVDSRFITNISATRGNVHDGTPMIQLISEQKREYGLSPEKLIGDAAYGSGLNRRLVAEYGTRIVAPVMSRAHENGDLYPKSMFEYDIEKQTVTCPQGMKTYKSTYDAKRCYTVYYFPTQVCEACASQDKCTNHAKGNRTVTVTLWEKEISEAERHNRTKLYKEEIRKRALIEATNSDLKRNHGMRRARYRGLQKVGLQFFFTAAVINIKRWISMALEEIKLKKVVLLPT